MENDIYKSPESNLETENAVEHELASRWSRLGASIIDGLTLAPITLPLMYFTGGFDGISEGIQPTIMYSLTIALIGIICFIAIHGYFLVTRGQTIGKKLLNIQIVTLDNEQAKLDNLFKRYGFYWLVPQVPAVGPLINLVNILMIFSKTKRCLHDHVGGTRVIKVSESQELDN